MENLQENSKIEISQESLGYLNTSRKWTMFFAILGFVFIGLFLLFSLFAGSLITGFTSGASGMEGFEDMGAAGGIASGIMMVTAIAFAVVYFFPMFFLFRFSRHMSNAIKNLDATEMQLAFKNHKLYWQYLGILVIIILIVYLIVMLVAGASFAFLSGMS
jgi:magnesium-transporting ATPase (P-type)